MNDHDGKLNDHDKLLKNHEDRIRALEEELSKMRAQVELAISLGKSGSGGGDIDLSGFEAMFAKLAPPHNTINRIEALEATVKELAERPVPKAEAPQVQVSN